MNNDVIVLIVEAMSVYLLVLWTHALVRVKRLESLLPVCSGCKRIRIEARQPGDADRWVPLEEYVRQETSTRFSHGFCSVCMRRLCPELSDAAIEAANKSEGHDPA
jgi:hypothetical protein